MIEGFCFHCYNLLHYANNKKFQRFNGHGNVLMVKCGECNNMNTFSWDCVPLQDGNYQTFPQIMIDF